MKYEEINIDIDNEDLWDTMRRQALINPEKTTPLMCAEDIENELELAYFQEQMRLPLVTKEGTKYFPESFVIRHFAAKAAVHEG